MVMSMPSPMEESGTLSAMLLALLLLASLPPSGMLT
jgi:hypothetical protein